MSFFIISFEFFSMKMIIINIPNGIHKNSTEQIIQICIYLNNMVHN